MRMRGLKLGWGESFVAFFWPTHGVGFGSRSLCALWLAHFALCHPAPVAPHAGWRRLDIACVLLTFALTFLLAYAAMPSGAAAACACNFPARKHVRP